MNMLLFQDNMFYDFWKLKFSKSLKLKFQFFSA